MKPLLQTEKNEYLLHQLVAIRAQSAFLVIIARSVLRSQFDSFLRHCRLGRLSYLSSWRWYIVNAFSGTSLSLLLSMLCCKVTFLHVSVGRLGHDLAKGEVVGIAVYLVLCNLFSLFSSSSIKKINEIAFLTVYLSFMLRTKPKVKVSSRSHQL